MSPKYDVGLGEPRMQGDKGFRTTFRESRVIFAGCVLFAGGLVFAAPFLFFSPSTHPKSWIVLTLVGRISSFVGFAVLVILLGRESMFKRGYARILRLVVVFCWGLLLLLLGYMKDVAFTLDLDAQRTRRIERICTQYMIVPLLGLSVATGGLCYRFFRKNNKEDR